MFWYTSVPPDMQRPGAWTRELYLFDVTMRINKMPLIKKQTNSLVHMVKSFLMCSHWPYFLVVALVHWQKGMGTWNSPTWVYLLNTITILEQCIDGTKHKWKIVIASVASSKYTNQLVVTLYLKFSARILLCRVAASTNFKSLHQGPRYTIKFKIMFWTCYSLSRPKVLQI